MPCPRRGTGSARSGGEAGRRSLTSGNITSLANYSPAKPSSISRVTDDEDWTDRHVARWRDHWIDVAFDDDVEAIVVRIGRLRHYFKLRRSRRWSRSASRTSSTTPCTS